MAAPEQEPPASQAGIPVAEEQVVAVRRPRVPLPIGESGRDALSIVRHHALPLYAAILLGYAAPLTIQALTAAGRDFSKISDAASIGLIVIQLVMSLLSEAAIVFMAGRALSGKDVRLAESYGAAGLRLPAYIITFLIASLVTFLGSLLFVVPGLVALGAFVFWRQAVILDGQSGTRALALSTTVGRGALWRIVGVLAVISVLQLSFVDVFLSGAQALADPASGLAIPPAMRSAVHQFLASNATRINIVVLCVYVFRMLFDPLVLAFVTALYVRLAKTTSLALPAESAPGAGSDAS